MAIYKPTDLLELLKSLNITPNKILSQNFLIDGNIIKKICETAHVQPGDLIIEIGPGPGALTEALLDRGAHVIAIEKDPVLAKALERLQGPEKKLEIFCEDIMGFPIEEILKERLHGGSKAKVVANLPYHITTPILANLVIKEPFLSTIVVMVQEEVARRFVAHPSTSEYSSFTIFLQFYSKPKYAFTVSRNCFMPKPSVESAVVTLELHPPALLEGQERFFELTRTAFKHRRKMLRASLRDFYTSEHIMETLEKIGVNAKARPENLSLEEWLCFVKALQQ